MIGFVAVAEIGYMLLAFGAALASIYPDPNTGAAVFSPAGITALKGGVFHILNDALDISLLFLVAGAIYYVSKESSLNKLGGLARNMKYTTVFFIIGLIAVSGLPPLNGFASKLMIYQSTYDINPIIAIVAILCSILMLAAFVKVFHAAFLGPKIPKFDQVKEVPKSMLISMFIIAFIIVFIGLFPNIVVENIVNPAVAALQNASTYIGGVI
jgi:multicomponent Na+:H+ antiporter subunit D